MAQNTGQKSPPTGPSVEYHWSSKKYEKLVENTQNPLLREFEQVELDYLQNKIENPQVKTFIDVGAGYGRVLPFIAPPRSRNAISVEINDDFFQELQKRSRGFIDAAAIQGDANNLSDLLVGQQVVSPVILSLQNSLGTWDGDANEAISQMRKVAEGAHGEVIISLLHQEELKNQGVEMYRSLQDMVGEIDLERTDFDKGIFRTKEPDSYLSRWRTKEERETIRQSLGGRLIALVEHSGFSILHVSYA